MVFKITQKVTWFLKIYINLYKFVRDFYPVDIAFIFIAINIFIEYQLYTHAHMHTRIHTRARAYTHAKHNTEKGGGEEISMKKVLYSGNKSFIIWMT